MPNGCQMKKVARECCPYMECESGSFVTSTTNIKSIGNGGLIHVLRPSGGMQYVVPTGLAVTTPAPGTGGTGFIAPRLRTYCSWLHIWNTFSKLQILSCICTLFFFTAEYDLRNYVRRHNEVIFGKNILYIKVFHIQHLLKILHNRIKMNSMGKIFNVILFNLKFNTPIYFRQKVQISWL